MIGSTRLRRRFPRGARPALPCPSSPPSGLTAGPQAASIPLTHLLALGSGPRQVPETLTPTEAPMTLRTFLPALLLLPLVGALACGDKDEQDDTSSQPTDGGSSSDDTGDTGIDDTPVWTEYSVESSRSVTGVYAANAQEVWVSMSDGGAMLFQSGSWNELTVSEEGSNDPHGEDVNGVWGSGAGTGATVVMVADAGNISTWTGSGFDTVDVGTANFESVDGQASNDLFAVGWGGLYSNVSGEWSYIDLPGDPAFNHVWYDGTSGAAVGEQGVLARYVGGEWIIDEDEEGRSFYGVSGTGANDIYAVGQGGVILHWNGTAWEDYSTTTKQSLWAVWAATSENVFVVGNAGTALVRKNGLWTKLPTGVNTNLYAIHGTGTNDVWAVGGFGTVLRYQPAAE